jgi:hypothetical protein
MRCFMVLTIALMVNAAVAPSNGQEHYKELGGAPTFAAAEESTMAYTVEYWTESDGGIVRTVMGRFDDPAFTELWSEMGVDGNMWTKWHAALSSGEEYVLLSDFPRLSILASADEGNIKFSGQRLQELYQECQRADAIVHGSKAKSILALLTEGANLALDGNGILVVHPFGTISPG